MNGIYISPAIVALLIFYHLRRKQASRHEKRRERLGDMYDRLIKMLQNNDAEKGYKNKADQL